MNRRSAQNTRLLRKPDWLKVRLPGCSGSEQVRSVLGKYGLNTICQEARCPNRAECFQEGTAAFLILGNICTRHCLYCNVGHGRPLAVDPSETDRLVEAVVALKLAYVVVTSVTRDDLADGGAAAFVQALVAFRKRVPGCRVEVLIPDFRGKRDALQQVLDAGPDVLNHNIEVVPELFPRLRPQGDYAVSLDVIRGAREDGRAVVKSGFMVGLGETIVAIEGLLRDLLQAGCEHVTIGQYQQPTREHHPVIRYYHPDEFESLKALAIRMGFAHVEAGPLVRSSYHAARSQAQSHND
jgi:lipoic acid synthetase